MYRVRASILTTYPVSLTKGLPGLDGGCHAVGPHGRRRNHRPRAAPGRDRQGAEHRMRGVGCGQLNSRSEWWGVATRGTEARGRWGVGCSLLRGGGIREEADAALSEPFHPTPQSQQPRHTRDTCSFSHPPSTPLYTPPHRTQIPLPPPPEFPSPPKKNKMKKSRSP